MFEEPEREQQRVVVVAPSAAQADLLVAALQAHGLPAAATVTTVRLGHEWVEGHAVSVATADEELALELLRALGAPPPPDDDGPRQR
ncbi:MAG: hypothetical protein R6V28_09840 [Nitriliruptoraceae bacterium]